MIRCAVADAWFPAVGPVKWALLISIMAFATRIARRLASG